jgi:hypothetical protein
LPFFEFYDKYPTKAARLARGMGGVSSSKLAHLFSNSKFTFLHEYPELECCVAAKQWFVVDRQLSELRDEYPWAALGKGKVVDIGGGSGHISLYLARVSFLAENMYGNKLADRGYSNFPILNLWFKIFLGI